MVPTAPTDQTDAEAVTAAVASPWRAIWTAPRAAMRHVLDNEAEYTFTTYGIAAASGVVNVLGSDFERFFGSDVPLLAQLGLAILVGPILGLVGIFVGGFLASAVGRMLGGAGSVEELRAAVAWGLLPGVALGALAVPAIVVLGPTLEPHLSSDAPLPSGMLGPSLALMLASLLATLGGVWSLVTVTKCVAEAHRFSAWRALAIPFISALASVALVIVLTAVFR